MARTVKGLKVARAARKAAVFLMVMVCTYGCTQGHDVGHPFANPVMLASRDGKLDVDLCVLHCHVAKHEDKGMMMTVEVTP